MRLALVSMVLGLTALSTSASAATDALRSCLHAHFTADLVDIRRDDRGSTLSYRATNRLRWDVGATYFNVSYSGPRGFKRQTAAFPLDVVLKSGETRVLNAKLWHTFPDSVTINDVSFDLVDVFDAEKRYLTGDGTRVHNWPGKRTKKDCTS